MSTIKKSNSLKTRLASAAVTVALVAGGGVLAAAPAQAAGSISLHAARDYASAQTWTNNGWTGRSYAQHGNRVAGWTAWTLSSSYAYADAGTSSSYYAAGQVRR